MIGDASEARALSASNRARAASNSEPRKAATTGLKGEAGPTSWVRAFAAGRASTYLARGRAGRIRPSRLGSSSVRRPWRPLTQPAEAHLGGNLAEAHGRGCSERERAPGGPSLARSPWGVPEAPCTASRSPPPLVFATGRRGGGGPAGLFAPAARGHAKIG